MNSKQIIVALDGMSQIEAIRIAKILKDKVWGFKVNDLIYEDVLIIRKLKKYGKVFADVKLHDIPNTVANSINRLSKLNVDIITVHASGGIEMLKAANLNKGKSKIIAVTVLTSSELKYKNEVVDLVNQSIKAKVDGIVCSGYELESIKRLQGAKKLIRVVPGIRSTQDENNDQKRTMSAQEALGLGATYLVIGRPITHSKNILKSLEDIVRG